MGYYSQVGYVIQGKKEEMVPIIMTYRLTYKDPAKAKAALDECTFSTDEDILTIKFHAESTKWYPGYEDVDNHTALFEAFQEPAEADSSSISGAFIRIGENDTDVVSEHFGSEPYELMYLVRKVEFEVEVTGSLEDALK